MFWWVLGTIIIVIYHATVSLSPLTTSFFEEVVVISLISLISGFLGKFGRDRKEEIDQLEQNRVASELAKEIYEKIIEEKFKKNEKEYVETINSIKGIESNKKEDSIKNEEIKLSKPLILYLRPFAVDGKILYPNPAKNWLISFLLPAQTFIPDESPFERLLFQALKGRNFVIYIGKQIGLVGCANVICSDDNWKIYFEEFARKATCIISIPSLSESTFWELEWLAANDYFHKVLMLFTEMNLYSHPINYEQNILLRRLSDLGYTLPRQVKVGSLVSFDQAGKFSQHIVRSKVKVSDIRFMVNTINQTFPEL